MFLLDLVEVQACGKLRIRDKRFSVITGALFLNFGAEFEIIEKQKNHWYLGCFVDLCVTEKKF